MSVLQILGRSDFSYDKYHQLEILNATGANRAHNNLSL